MSTVGKIDPLAKQRRAKRAAFLRTAKPSGTNTDLFLTLVFALRKIHKDPRLSGAQKHELFRRGVRQLVAEKLIK